MATDTARTSMNLPKALVKQAKHVAVEEGKSLGEIVSAALVEYLKGKSRGQK